MVVTVQHHVSTAEGNSRKRIEFGRSFAETVTNVRAEIHGVLLTWRQCEYLAQKASRSDSSGTSRSASGMFWGPNWWNAAVSRGWGKHHNLIFTNL